MARYWGWAERLSVLNRHRWCRTLMRTARDGTAREAPAPDALPRRAFLGALLAAAASPVLLAATRGPALRAAPGSPALRAMRRVDDVTIVDFADDGTRRGAMKVAKVVKSDREWRAQLSPLAYSVTRRGDTEIPFTGAYWNVHEAGLFRCICCETALFGSDAKFDSGTGWPSFTRPIARENVVTRRSRSTQHVESELTCVRCDAHLGDVFDDGPRPAGLRYCIDSVALRFVKRR